MGYAARTIDLISASPRRLQLLQAAGFQVRVTAPRGQELWPGGVPAAAVVALAKTKLASVPVRGLALAADTVVVLDDQVLHKPADAQAAARCLQALAGRWHEVYTGFALQSGAHQHSQSICTRVRLRPLKSAEIAAYIATGEPMDKAGAYGIQGLGGALVDQIHGSYPNVVGLPMAEVVAAVAAVPAMCG